jgi:hypothetical protein
MLKGLVKTGSETFRAYRCRHSITQRRGPVSVGHWDDACEVRRRRVRRFAILDVFGVDVEAHVAVGERVAAFC